MNHKKTQNQDYEDEKIEEVFDEAEQKGAAADLGTESEELRTADSGDFSAQITELTNDLQRTRADFENYRKAVEAQKSQAMAAAKYATVVKFLTLVDDLERAISAYPEQLSPLAKNFTKTLSNLGLAQINSAVGTEFNPDFHEAVSVEDGGGEVEVIAETLRPGYLYEKTVIRPAMVKVKR